jgi:hypothetical protein
MTILAVGRSHAWPKEIIIFGTIIALFSGGWVAALSGKDEPFAGSEHQPSLIISYFGVLIGLALLVFGTVRAVF